MLVVMLVVPVLIALALIVLGMRAFAARLRARQVALEDELVRTGTETIATVTRAPAPQRGWNRNTGVWGQVVFTFRDTAGLEREVTRRVLVRRPGDVTQGDTTRLWFDATAPEDAKRVVVELEQQTRPGR